MLLYANIFLAISYETRQAVVSIYQSESSELGLHVGYLKNQKVHSLDMLTITITDTINIAHNPHIHVGLHYNDLIDIGLAYS